jgi:hypothetical protein
MTAGITRARLVLVAAAIVATLSVAPKAAADQTSTAVSSRINVGAGFGNSQLAARLGWSTDFWVSTRVGLGTHLGSLIQLSVPRSSLTYMLGPELALRSDPVASGFWLGTVSAGYAVDSVTTTVSCEHDCFFGSKHEWYPGAYGSLEVAYMSEGRRFLGGIGFRGEAAGWPGNTWTRIEAAITLNLIGGIKLP